MNIMQSACVRACVEAMFVHNIWLAWIWFKWYVAYNYPYVNGMKNESSFYLTERAKLKLNIRAHTTLFTSFARIFVFINFEVSVLLEWMPYVWSMFSLRFFLFPSHFHFPTSFIHLRSRRVADLFYFDSAL